MSQNQLAVLSSNLPAYLLDAGADDITSSLAATKAINRLSIKGGVWRWMKGDQEIAKNTDNNIQVIIVDASPKMGRAWYSQSYNPNAEGVTPDCWSNDDERPNPKSRAPQADLCRNCPKSIRGSGANGGAACRIQRRLALALPGQPDGEFLQMILPATSLLGDEKNGAYPLMTYATKMANNRPPLPISGFVTEMSFDTDAETPKVLFRPIQPLGEAEYRRLTERRLAGETNEFIAMDFRSDEAVQAQQPQLAGAPVQYQPPAHVAGNSSPVQVAPQGFQPAQQMAPQGFQPAQAVQQGFQPAQAVQQTKTAPAGFTMVNNAKVVDNVPEPEVAPMKVKPTPGANPQLAEILKKFGGAPAQQ